MGESSSNAANDPPAQQSLDCPKCGTSMQRVYIAAAIIDRCEICGGLWFDALEKERLLKHPVAVRKLDRGPLEPARVMNKVTKIHCPRDGSLMIHQADPQQFHIRYESCSVCGGVYLDAGELRDLSEVTLLERLKAMLG